MSTIVARDAEPHVKSRVGWGEKAWLAVIAILFLAIAVRSASVRPLWFDELSTLFITLTPTLGGMWHAIPTDGNPPLYFLLARPLLHLPIRTELALRIPSILGMAGAGAAVYVFVRRSANWVFAMLAMGLLLGSFVAIYSIQARPYALLMGCTGLLVCCWQAAIRNASRRLALAGITIGTAMAIFSLQYGVIYALTPLFAGEVVRFWRRRRVDWPVLLCAGAGTATLLITFPPMLRAQAPLLAAIRSCPVFWGHPQLIELRGYADMIPHFGLFLAGLVIVVVFIAYAAFPSAPASEERPTTSAEEFAAAGAMVLILPILLLVTHFGTGYFRMRYASGTAMGMALLIAMVLAELSERWPKVRYVAMWGAIYSLLAGVFVVWGAATPTEQAPTLLLHSPDSSEPIVIASARHFSPDWWYASPPMRARLHYLTDLSDAERHSDPIPEYSLALEREYLPMRMDSYRDFTTEHHQFLLYCYGISQLEWVKERLEREGWTLTAVARYQQQTMYQVMAPSRAR